VNRFIRVFGVLFVVFLIILLLNSVDQMNTPLSGDWTVITNNFLGLMPYVMLIFFGLFYALKRSDW
jgi:hypothetical protein